MKRILAPVLFLLLLMPSVALGLDYKDLVERPFLNGIYYKKFTDVPFTGKVTGQWQGKIRKGKKHGPWVHYHKNGQLRSKGTYKDGKEEGPWVGYHKNGKLNFKGTYKDGKYDGPWVKYHENGQLNYKGTFKNGKLEGPWVGYNNFGTVNTALTGTFKNGKKISD